MSLVGSLEDLGLVDILQIVSLSRKSGALFLRCDRGEGRILLRDGLVQGAQIKGAPESLRALLMDRGLVDGIGFDCARERVENESISLDAALQQECDIAPEALDALRREHVERSVMRMFTWRSGEFSFEIREDFGDEDGLLLAAGLNTQYLAMEATRLGDETGRSDEVEDDLADDMMFSGEESVEAAPDPVDSLAMASARQVAPESEAVEHVPVALTPAEATDVPVSVEAASAPPRPETPVARPATAIQVLVAVDPDLSSLEWLKASVDGVFRQVHIFQQRDQAVERIRQYLVRGQVPLLVMSDPTANEARDVELLIGRMRGLAPRMPILTLRPEGVDGALTPGVHDVLYRPSSPSADPDRWHLYEAQSEALRSRLEPWVTGEQQPG